MKDSEKSFVDLSKARTQEQLEVMKDILEEGVCPFCPEHLEKYHNKPILRRGDHWLLTENQWPYKRTIKHLLLIATYHVESMRDLAEGSYDELQDHLTWAESEYNLRSYAFATRIGSIATNGATVRHLHGHIIQPTGEDPEQPVRFKIG